MDLEFSIKKSAINELYLSDFDIFERGLFLGMLFRFFFE
jgi:hypothetical protein